MKVSPFPSTLGSLMALMPCLAAMSLVLAISSIACEVNGDQAQQPETLWPTLSTSRVPTAARSGNDALATALPLAPYLKDGHEDDDDDADVTYDLYEDSPAEQVSTEGLSIPEDYLERLKMIPDRSSRLTDAQVEVIFSLMKTLHLTVKIVKRIEQSPPGVSDMKMIMLNDFSNKLEVLRGHLKNANDLTQKIFEFIQMLYTMLRDSKTTGKSFEILNSTKDDFTNLVKFLNEVTAKTADLMSKLGKRVNKAS